MAPTDHHLASIKYLINCRVVKGSYFFKEPCLINGCHLGYDHNTRFRDISYPFLKSDIPGDSSNSTTQDIIASFGNKELKLYISLFGTYFYPSVPLDY